MQLTNWGRRSISNWPREWVGAGHDANLISSPAQSTSTDFHNCQISTKGENGPVHFFRGELNGSPLLAQVCIFQTLSRLGGFFFFLFSTIGDTCHMSERLLEPIALFDIHCKNYNIKMCINVSTKLSWTLSKESFICEVKVMKGDCSIKMNFPGLLCLSILSKAWFQPLAKFWRIHCYRSHVESSHN